MALFKDVKKPVIRQARTSADISPLRPKFVTKQPPCAAGCGAGADVRAWVNALAQGEAYGRSPAESYEEAWRILADAQPFPATLGRICPHTCERGCHRVSKDGAVALNALERWLGDAALARGFALPLRPRAAHQGRIAVIGAGPAGLSCAYQLARRGHQVTVFEREAVPGGRLRDGVRSGRLAAGVVDAEIDRVLRLGVTLRCTTPVGEPRVRLETLMAEHDFVVVATGRAAAIELPAAAADAVLQAGDVVKRGLVSEAIAGGRVAAEAIHDRLEGRTTAQQTTPPAIEAARLKVDWYPAHPRCEYPVDATDVSDAAAIAEAKRCLSCGLCMDCERCWMFCTNNCFEKLPKGQHYRVAVDPCNGCRKCAEECPCGYIDMV